MNKKRLITLILTLIFTLGMCTSSIYAASPENQHLVSKEITYFSDGTRLETVIYQSDISTFASNTTTGTKTATYYSGDQALWYVTLRATFTYSGHSSLCNSSSVDAGSYVSNWKIIDKYTSYSGNQATGEARGRFYMGITPIHESTLGVILTCDIDGNLK